MKENKLKAEKFSPVTEVVMCGVEMLKCHVLVNETVLIRSALHKEHEIV